ncbi:MAG: sensor histidine kinase [Flavobacteriales bacterium]|nr:MAG: sensor histidine kinase [Flavobacteriales bacterium]
MIASVVQEEDISINEVVNILKESQEVISLNRQLKIQSDQLQRLTNDLQNANNRLQKLSEIKDDFLYTVTHELRTPLTSIRTQAELLLEMGSEMEPEEEQNFLQTMVRDCERLTRLISDVLDLEKFESGNQKLNLAKHQITKVIDEVVSSMRQSIDSKKIRLEVNLADSIPTTYFDYDRMVQVFTNLLSNATKFCNQDNGYIRISGYQVDNKIKLNVIDNGDGIDAEKALRIFDKFYQAHNQLRKKPLGSGLGLAICKNIVQLHGGSIYMVPEPQSGSRFSVEIPIYKTDFTHHG